MAGPLVFPTSDTRARRPQMHTVVDDTPRPSKQAAMAGRELRMQEDTDTRTQAPILIVYASRHGSTREIAEGMADELRTLGIDAEVSAAEQVPSVAGYAAVVLGSAVYVGHWLPAARTFVEHFQTQLGQMPVWLFSSGPLGTVDPQPVGIPIGIDELLDRTQARGHHVFSGKMEIDALRIGERLLVRMVGAPEGDFRDWEAIHAWAGDVAAQVATASLPTAA